MNGSEPACAGLIRLSEAELRRRLGEPQNHRRAGDEVWLVFVSPELTLRVRCQGEGPCRVRSWTATFSEGRATLASAAGSLGLWPAAAPDQAAAETSEPLMRRPLVCGDDGATYTLTATVRQGTITQISVFDEPPDWC